MRENEYLLRLAELIGKRQWDDAYVFFCENKGQYSRAEGKRLSTILVLREAVNPHRRQTVLLLIFTALFQLCTVRFFENQLQDLFSFLGAYYRPYMYVSSLSFLVIGIVVDLFLLRRCYIDFVWTNRLLSRPILRRNVVGTFALFTFLIGFSLYQSVPLLQDLPAVIASDYTVGIITREQHEATIMGNAYVKQGLEPPVAEYDPVMWVETPRWSEAMMPFMPGVYNRSVLEISVNGARYRMGRLQFQMMGCSTIGFPVTIEYLPHSGILLWITNGEE